MCYGLSTTITTETAVVAAAAVPYFMRRSKGTNKKIPPPRRPFKIGKFYEIPFFFRHSKGIERATEDTLIVKVYQITVMVVVGGKTVSLFFSSDYTLVFLLFMQYPFPFGDAFQQQLHLFFPPLPTPLLT